MATADHTLSISSRTRTTTSTTPLRTTASTMASNMGGVLVVEVVVVAVRLIHRRLRPFLPRTALRCSLFWIGMPAIPPPPQELGLRGGGQSRIRTGTQGTWMQRTLSSWAEPG